MTLITREYVKVTGTGQAEVDWELVAQVIQAAVRCAGESRLPHAGGDDGSMVGQNRMP